MRGEQDCLSVGAGVFSLQHTNRVVCVSRSVLSVNLEGDHSVRCELCEALACILGDGENGNASAERASGIGKMRIDGSAFVLVLCQSFRRQRWIFAEDRLHSSSISAPSDAARLCAEG